MEETTQPIFMIISLLFVLIGLVLISTLLASSDPYAFIATSNTEKLRNAMEQACGGQGQKISFSLPQNIPIMTSMLSFTTSWLLYEGGDPHYTLYYEMFPAGDAIGWESYQKFESKALAYVTEDAVNVLGQRVSSTDDAEEYIKNVKKKLDDKEIGTDIVILRNVILNSEFPHYRNYRVDRREKTGSSSDDFVSSFFGFGEWKRVNSEGDPLDGDNFFEFSNYDALPAEEKTAIKYMPCGDHSLCLKTRSGVYRYELPNCEAQNIKYVALAYEERSVAKGVAVTAGAVTAGTAVAAGSIYFFGAGAVAKAILWTTPKFILTHPIISAIGTVGGTYAASGLAHYFSALFLSYKASDFSITSPCAAEEMEITRVRCGDIPNEYSCNSMEKIPIMKYDKDDGILPEDQYREYHYTCTEKFNDKYDSTPNIHETAAGEISDENCLLVKVTKLPEGYCWTPDPYKELSAGGLFTDVPTQVFARNMGLNPVREYTSYMYQNMDGVSPVTLLLPWADEGLLVDRNSPLISWGWPQHKGEGIIDDIVKTGETLI